MPVVRRPEVGQWWRRSGEQELRELLNAWDPIGVFQADPEWPRDEYDPYLSPIFDALREGHSVDDVRQALARALSRMGQGPAGPREDAFAERILRWWEQSFPEP